MRSSSIAGGALLAALGAFWLVAFGAIAVLGLRGPTGPAFAVMLRNDTSRTVVLKECDVRATRSTRSTGSRRGSTVEVNVSDQDVAKWAGPIRPLAVSRYGSPRRQTEVVVNVSTMTGPPCQEATDERVARG
jgi:hypothetical protein